MLKISALGTLLLAVLLAAPLIPGVSAHNGNGCGFSGNRLEGECYSTPDSGCDPDSDSEHTQVVTGSYSNSAAGFLPNANCGFNFNSMSAPATGKFTTFKAAVGGTGSTVTLTVNVYADGTLVSSGGGSIAASQGLVQFTFSTQNTVASGSHTFRATYSLSPSYMNLYLDYVDFTPSTSGPPNDNFAGTTIGTGTQTGSTIGATLQSGEPQPCGSIGSTVWYSWTPSSSGTATLDTLGSGYDTVLAAYTGSSLTGLSNVACNDDFSGTTSQVQFAATSGTTYRIQAGGYTGNQGSLTLHVALSGPSATVPGAPQSPYTSDVGPGKVQVSWSAPSSNGGSAITAYDIYGGTTSASTFLTQVSASTRSWTESSLQPGLRTYAVSAVNAVGEGSKSSSVSMRAYWSYTVEMKAYIPFDQVVDPLLPSTSGYSYHDAAAADGVPPNSNAECGSWYEGMGSTVWAWFEGDHHTNFDGTSRVRSKLVFNWDGQTVNHLLQPNEGMYGTSYRWRHYQSDYGFAPESCVIASGPPNSGELTDQPDSTSFHLYYNTNNPLVNGSPTITGELRGTFDSAGDIILNYDMDEFPTHAFQVIKDGGNGAVVQLTSYPTWTSCLTASQVMGATGYSKLTWGLNNDQGWATTNIVPWDANRVEWTNSHLC